MPFKVPRSGLNNHSYRVIQDGDVFRLEWKKPKQKIRVIVGEFKSLKQCSVEARRHAKTQT